MPVETPYLRSKKYPGGARFSCTDSFRTPRSEGKFSCKSGIESLCEKQTQGDKSLSMAGSSMLTQKHILDAEKHMGQQSI